MPEEYLDIVDENGNLTGEKEFRSVVHEKGLCHRVAVVYFYRIKNNDIEILVHLRSKFKDQNANKWAPRFGGHIESGSTIEKAVIKEIQEEVGILVDFKNLKIGIKLLCKDIHNKEISYTFYYEFNDDIKNLVFNDGEVQEVKWMNEFEIEKSMYNNPEIWSGEMDGFLEIMQDLKSKI